MAKTIERNPLQGIRGRNLRGSLPGGDALTKAVRHTPPLMGTEAPGERFFFWLGQAARQAREEADVQPEAIALRVKRGRATVDRWEAGGTNPRSWS